MTDTKATMGIHSYDAAAAAVAQSIANATQDQVDLIRNQNIIKTTAAGTALAKWLSNPMMKDEYQAIITETSVDQPKDSFNVATSVFKIYEEQAFGNKDDDAQPATNSTDDS